MVISHRRKYVFLELPHTGSTTIRRELCELYDGEPILYRHATYYDFERIASDEEKAYFIFGSVRNPLDVAVTRYFRYKTNHNRRYTDSIKVARKNIVDTIVEGTQFDFVRKNDADFADFFLKFYRVPYNTWSSVSHRHFDYVIRFENLADDFSEALKRLGIEQVRPLQVLNKTRAKNEDFWSYYTLETRERAKRVFGLYMQQWGYKFPPEWGDATITTSQKLAFGFLTFFRILYWRYVRHLVFKYRFHHSQLK